MNRFFKITNKKEKHGGLQYKDGLFCDSREYINKIENWGSGVYFSDKDNIVAFCLHGFWIREVLIPDDALFCSGRSPKEYKTNKIFFKKRRPFWNIATLRWLKKIGVNLEIWDNSLVRNCISKNYLEEVKFLIENCKFTKLGLDNCINQAYYSKKDEVVDFLKKHARVL